MADRPCSSPEPGAAGRRSGEDDGGGGDCTEHHRDGSPERRWLMGRRRLVAASRFEVGERWRREHAVEYNIGPCSPPSSASTPDSSASASSCSSGWTGTTTPSMPFSRTRLPGHSRGVVQHLILVEEEMVLNGRARAAMHPPWVGIRPACAGAWCGPRWAETSAIRAPVPDVVPQVHVPLTALALRWKAARADLMAYVTEVPAPRWARAAFRHPRIGWMTAMGGLRFLGSAQRSSPQAGRTDSRGRRIPR